MPDEEKGEAKGSIREDSGSKQSKGGLDDDRDSKATGPAPSVSQLEFMQDGYNQTYVIRKATGMGSFQRELLFRCGNWCYGGRVDLGFPALTLSNLPAVVPHLQRQQGGLKYLCEASVLGDEEPLASPLKLFYSDINRIAETIGDDSVMSDIEKWGETFTWLKDESGKTYFELKTSQLDGMKTVEAICSKTYNRGLVLVTVYFEGSYYTTIQDGEGVQPLLDVQFPDVSEHGQGFHVRSWGPEEMDTRHWQKLTLWQVVENEDKPASTSSTSASSSSSSSAQASAKPQPQRSLGSAAFKDARGEGYAQSYCVMKQGEGAQVDAPREVLFRFGNWCYSGRVRLSQRVSLPYLRRLIPELRMQQSSLEFVYDVGAIPAYSPYVNPMSRLATAAGAMARQLAGSTEALEGLLEKIGSSGSSIDWVDQPGRSFFEFSCVGNPAYENVELMASKVYTCGVILVLIYYEDTYYALIQDGSNELPLLDSLFPDVSARGKGYQLETYAAGLEGWEEVRKLSLWQVSSSDASLTSTAAPKNEAGAAGGGASSSSSKEEAQAEEHEEGAKAEGDAKAGPKVSSVNPAKPKLAPAKVSMPHHLAPLGSKGGAEGGGGRSPLSSLGPAPWERSLGPAPWDATGRPKQLGEVGGSKKHSS